MQRRGGVLKIILAFLIFLFGGLAYFFSVEENPITGERQRVAITPQEEVELGLAARGQLVRELGGVLSEQTSADQTVDAVGETLVAELHEMVPADAQPLPYAFEFHVLADEQTVNALALPGGQIFLTQGLLARLQNRDQLAAVLAHEVGHVIHRHASQRMAKAQLKARMATAIDVASEDGRPAAAAELVGALLELRYSRKQELESDRWGLELMQRAGYRPEAMLELLEIFRQTGGPFCRSTCRRYRPSLNSLCPAADEQE